MPHVKEKKKTYFLKKPNKTRVSFALIERDIKSLKNNTIKDERIGIPPKMWIEIY